MKEIVIVGAGLSGMVAAVNLARRGREVRVLEREKRLGGSPRLHPSVHITPLNAKGILEYTGVDVAPAFAPVRDLRIYIEDRGYDLPRSPFYSVERGPRETSLDSYLHGLARDAGVKFEFGQPVRRLADLPPGSIIATGFHPELVQEAGRTVFRVSGFGTHMESDREGFSTGYLDRYANDYFYLGVQNGLAYGLIFGRYQTFRGGELDEALGQLEEREGLRFDTEWTEIDVSPCNNPHLFTKGMIFTGSSAGMIDPSAGFGINAALFSGGVAARAVDDPEGALRDFRRYNRFFSLAMSSWVGMQWTPFLFGVMKFLFNHPRLCLPVSPLASRFVPGMEENWWRPVLENIRPVER